MSEQSPATRTRAVLFDLGGVILGSPFAAISAFEQRHALPPGSITRAIFEAGDDGAFQRLERGELDVPGFGAAFAPECAARGLSVDGVALIAAISAAMLPQPGFFEAVVQIRARGLVAAALTNNWHDEPSMAELAPRFDFYLESCKLGMRKPDPRIYVHTCERLGVAPEQIVYLDDIGSNLKAARALGMRTILVREARQALVELEQALGFPLA